MANSEATIRRVVWSWKRLNAVPVFLLWVIRMKSLSGQESYSGR